MEDIKTFSILTCVALVLLTLFFTIIPVAVGLVALPFYFKLNKGSRVFFCIFSIICGSFWVAYQIMAPATVDLWVCFTSLLNFDFNTIFFFFFQYQSFMFMLLGLVCGAGFTIYTLRFLWLLCAGVRNKNLEQVLKGQKGTKYNTKESKKKKGKYKELDVSAGAIGVSYANNKVVGLSDKTLNEMLLALGTTGAGKTVFFRNLYVRHILLGQATIVVDGKPSPKNINFLKALAEEKGVPFYGFNCANNLGYDFLNNGTPTEIMNKLIGLKNERDWSSDHYKSLAETYLQTAIEVLKKVKGKITLDDIIDSFKYDDLIGLLPDDLDEKLNKKLSRIKHISTEELTGIQAQLVILSNSDLGDWLSSGSDNEFTLLEAINSGGFVYFGLPALKYPSFAKVLGKVVVNDVKTALYDKSEDTEIFGYFDEFSVFAGEQVLNLVNQGRGLGLNCSFGTQSIADLSFSAGHDFLEVFMGNINTLAVMRVNDNKTTNYLAEWIGKEEVQEYQAHVNHRLRDTGTVKLVDKYIVKPSEMQQLPTGDAYLITKVGSFSVDKIKVNYIDENTTEGL